MALFRKREEEIDLKPENRRVRKEPSKPWGKKERIFVLLTLLLTVIISFLLDLSSRDYKLPGFPRLKLVMPSLDIFKGETIIVGNKQEDKTIAKEKIVKEFEDKTKELSGVYALYVADPNSNFSFGIDENEIMQAASLIKLPAIVGLYKEAEAGKISLDTKYSLKSTDKVGGSGSLYAKPTGTIYTYRELVNLMGKQSDNTAFNVIRKILGDEKINAVAKEIGMTSTSLNDNSTTAKDMGTFFIKLYQGEIVSEIHKNEILDSLTNTIYESWMIAGIPEDVRVAHKYGREIHVVNDAGIIFADKPFILVLLTRGVVEKEADEVFPELTGIVYRRMIE